MEIAYPETTFLRLPTDIPPTTPDFEGEQFYFQPAPLGIDVPFAQGFLGGYGKGVDVADVEYLFHTTHEDLELCIDAILPNQGTPMQNVNFTGHGTAVMGVLFAGHNGYGISGSLVGANCHFAYAYVEERGYIPAQGIATAMQVLEPPALLLIEFQVRGPNYDPDSHGGMLPVEYTPAVYDTIRTAVASGIVVVEPAGNGWEDLDAELYGDTFNPDVHNSGAIIVGAGMPMLPRYSAREPELFANYGSRVNVQGWGSRVTTTGGYGGLFNGDYDVNQYYTGSFLGDLFCRSHCGLRCGVAPERFSRQRLSDRLYRWRRLPFFRGM